MLAMEDDRGQSRLVAGEDLGTLLQGHRSLRLAVLNSCGGARGDRSDPFSGTAQSLIQQGIPAVVAMQFEITDDAAITFSRVLYKAIADGYPLDAATTETRKAIYADGNLTEWGTPALYSRASDARIFDIQDRPPRVLTPSSSPRLEEAAEQARPAEREAEQQQAWRQAAERVRRGAEDAEFGAGGVMAGSRPVAPGRIFISYRRAESGYSTGWLYERLANHFGREDIVRDIDSIAPGDDFAEVIGHAVASCDVMLVVIGTRWINISDDDGQRRLDDPDDFVRREIEAALQRDIRVIPILVDGATMPHSEQLPPSLIKLRRRQALDLSPQRFQYDVDRLLRVLDKTVSEEKK
jgi:hypothetical protein